jgi:cellulose synthase/poly-beta-1,6-N-acetylglucosamine synthase-like glycosyltransferase
MLGRYTQRTDYAGLIERHIYVDPQEDQANTAPLTKKKAKAANRSKASKAKKAAAPRVYKSKLALLIAAHDEELVIEQTIRSAINAGQDPKHIYVVDDNSTDATSDIALSILRPGNVIKVGRSGKGLALTKAAHEFNLVAKYDWIHIADADGGFVEDYFKIFRKSLDPSFAAATGYVRSLPSGIVGQYRVMEYTLGQELHRRFQAMTHTVTVIPGPTSCFRSDIFAKVNFANKSMTEDFDVTIQIHRQKLGKIQFIPKAVAYTQDPRDLKDFTKQITRWNRGMMQTIRRHRLTKRAHRIDAYLGYLMLQNFMMFFNYVVILPFAAYVMHSPHVLAVAFLTDVMLMFGLTVLMALKAGRYDIISAFPHIYIYRWVTLYVFLKAFVEVMILRKFKTSEGIWGTAGRRYKNAVTV